MDDQDAHDMAAKMHRDTGMPMKMYSRDEISQMSESDMEWMSMREQMTQERMAAKMMESGEL